MSTSTTRACPKCNSAIAATSQFCPSCGTAVSGIFSGGGSPMDGTAVVGVESVDTVLPMLQDATLGHYDIYGELGRGGMAAVYLALDLKLNRKVAIKTMLPDLVSREGMVARFRREAQVSAALSHPHIIQIFSVEETDHLVFFVMKYIEGRSLESIILERGRLDVDLVRVVISQAGSALAFAHRKNVVHRDVKPANIMLEEDGWAIVTDFGIAKVQEAMNLTATGTAIGTPHYMSPEQFHNKAVTGQSDQYSLGIVAYEMLTARKPFDGATYAEIITQHLFEAPPDLREIRPDVPVNVAETIMKMMSKSAADRFPDLDAAVSALGLPSKTQGDVARTQIISLAKSGPEKKLRMSVPISPVPQTRTKPKAKTGMAPAAATIIEPPKPVEKQRSKGWLFIAAALLILLGGGGGIWAVVSRIPQQQSPVNPQAGGKVQLASPTTLAVTGTPSGQAPGVAGAVLQSSATGTAVTTPPATPPATVETKAAPPAPPLTAKEKARAKADSIKAARAKAKADKDRKTALAVNANARTSKPPAETPRNVVAATPNVVASPTAAPPVQEPPKPTAIVASVKIASRTEGAQLFVNGVNFGPLKGLVTKEVTARANGTVWLKISADKCTTWDSTVAVTAGQKITVGRHDLTCQP